MMQGARGTKGHNMENLADISEPQVLPNEQKDQEVHFSIC